MQNVFIFLLRALMCVFDQVDLFSSDVGLSVHGKCFRSIRWNEWAQCSPRLSFYWFDLVPLNNKVKFHSPICSAPLYRWHWIVFFSRWIINPIRSPCFGEMISGHKHCDYWFSVLTASSAKWQEEQWTAQDILCVKSGVCISNENRYPGAEMYTSRQWYRSNEDLFDYKKNTIQYMTQAVLIHIAYSTYQFVNIQLIIWYMSNRP